MAKQNPVTQFYHEKYEKQPQDYPGLQHKMTPVPDCGEETYQGAEKLVGKKALVTGADSGIGRAAAIAYAKEGADVAIAYHPDEQQDAEDVKAVIEKAGQTAVLLPGDLRDATYAKQMVKDAYDALGGLDILVLNAGMQQFEYDIQKLDPKQLTDTFEVNVFSTVYSIQEALNYLEAGSSIILTSSIQAMKPSPHLLDYAMTKSCNVSLTKGLAAQLGPKGIRVNAVAPGPVWTPLQICGGQPQVNIPEFGQNQPLQRAGQPVELADVYVLLASENASFITGQVYGVTGGAPIN
ncbi:SDR family NAD(P)-dependent oxidoreductase [Staphylococcus felis]|uniref:SDR family NAD(P)-dependent oxidoreductase n=1 Tax=Staphylococcus felis TaxID=46127 RepID=A0AAX1RVP4_9STAP|nr:SDR family oxidoreductase [Staphylococcus felis]AVP36285.1 KR domain-containing protein [Staphylococcus felis]PNZ34374.1 NAD(P)-dependent dehydrogenase [Staphylococcus felis]QQB03746.1 SDR family oxidoreductase [Staphylococcus felis]REH76568.1 SDR family NAD(P)-dependent oxidoreductase [Staphylococcus felis]REH78770.1 SDR family NAD(P)-dependent oxidoreductase [Staphylococcus felis]